ncbi:TetR family transcriptional regulator [Mucilaginibacter gracilis]|uniref:TetR family transcriptional regulator n=1 Tax=Mucilaginibacter gracilis TaxID=423350 RepID=A0A495IUX5_9SPHI|nr:TetR/AcrR family transcriptional regulator [Mucilaginibacter gracilis]RKR80372.1 TetR family transcriptional regulator [Mucilaginibacter gracilis]
METLATDTEQLIKDTAKKVFFVDGNIHATTQDIADAAGINRASIHYYYRSRKLLFDKVFTEAITEMRSKMHLIAVQNLPIREKTGEFIDFFFEKSLQHPYLELFVITERNSNNTLKLAMTEINKDDMHKELDNEIQKEVAKGLMKPITANHFVMTMISLCSFPFLGRSIVQGAINVDDETYSKMLTERKKIILQLFFLDV